MEMPVVLQWLTSKYLFSLLVRYYHSGAVLLRVGYSRTFRSLYYLLNRNCIMPYCAYPP